MSVTRINQFIAREGEGGRLRDALKALVPVIEDAEGCLSCQLLQSRDDPLHMVLIEVWESVDLHRQSLEDVPAEVFDSTSVLLAAPPTGGYYDFCAL